MEIKILKKDEFEELIPSYVSLNNKVFNAKVDEQYFRWRYLENPLKDILVCAAIDKGKVVANYSASPINIIDSNNLLYKSAQSLNTMTDPNYQGKGLFIKTANYLYEYLNKNEYQFIWGFPNNLSHWVFNNKLDWKDVYEFPTLSLNLLKLKDKFENKIIDSEFIQITLDNIDNYIFYQNLFENHLQIKKCSQYLKWRYLTNPLNEYHVYCLDGVTNDYVVFKIFNNKLNVVELEVSNISNADKLIELAIQFAIRHNLEYVTIWLPINSKEYSLIEKKGFWLDLPIFHLGIKVFNKQIDSQCFKWNISQGDHNVF